MIQQSKIFEVYEDTKKRYLYTKNLINGISVYGERLVKQDGVEYREWDATRSKLAASILKGSPNVGIKKGDIVLYLGCSSGTTPSHVSDMVGEGGFIFAIDIAPRVLREMVYTSEKRKNICPILADASKPIIMADRISQVDVVYQDIAQRNQGEIFLKNCDMYLKKGGFALLAVKARSIDVTKKPDEIYRAIQKELETRLTIIDYRKLDPFEKDHCMFICKKK